MAQITTFIYGAIITGGIIALLGVFLGGIAISNPSLTDYNNESFQSLNKLTELSSQAQQIQGNVSQIKEKENILDIIGGFFSSAYQSMVITYKSVDSVQDMTNEGIAQANLGSPGIIIRNILITLVLIAVFVGVAMRAIIKPGGKDDL